MHYILHPISTHTNLNILISFQKNQHLAAELIHLRKKLDQHTGGTPSKYMTPTRKT